MIKLTLTVGYSLVLHLLLLPQEACVPYMQDYFLLTKKYEHPSYT